MPDSQAKKDWDRKNTRQISIKLNRNTDADILQKIESMASYAGYIKELIRRDIARSETK